MKRICRLAKVPVLHAQSMRGGHSSLVIRAGGSPHLVAASPDNASPAVTLSNYAEAGAVSAGRQERFLKVVGGGKR